MKNIFTKHPHSINETYFEHLKFAALFGAKMIVGGLACITHALFPFVFEKTGSNFLLKMAHDFVDRMPHAEERMIKLSKSLEKKLVVNKE